MAGWQAKDVDLWEVNEAFAAVTMAAMNEFKLPHEDRPTSTAARSRSATRSGASGARIARLQLLGARRQRGKKRGVAALCIGGGEATSMAVELL